MDLATKLVELEQRMSQLIRWRDETLRQAKRIIAQTNSEFDELAIPIGRDINELRGRLALDEADKAVSETPAPKRRRRKPPELDGLNDAEQEHYLALLERKRNK